ncbi:MAG: DUF4351 domain-containing protein [Candidatus Contendobacter sp.]|nr:DUF4351 domain-containing protein [Candidatus Contendobacter sp.]
MKNPSRTRRKPPDRSDDFDSPWKTLLDRWFPAFMAWFFPPIAAEIDWARGYVFLDKELQKISRRAQEKRRHADKLVKVWRGTGEEMWVLVHVEIQAGQETDFAERMFVYYYRLFDRYRLPLASLVVLADDRPQWRPDRYQRQLWGCELKLTFPMVKLLDYQGRLAELETAPNPFALATAAHLLARATRKDPQGRLAGKLALTRRLYQRGWTKPEVLDLYEFIDWLLALPGALEDAFLDEIHDLEASTKMRYISSAERIGMKRGTQLGIQQVLRRQLRRRFGEPPAWVESKLQEGTPPQLEQWADQLLDADTLEAVFKE